MRPKKHPKANLENFSILFMQLGLVFALFLTYVMIEKKTESNVVLLEDYILNEYRYDTDETVEIEVEKIKLPPVPDPIIIMCKPKVIDDDEENFIETVLKADDIDAPLNVLKDIGTEEVIEEEIIEDVSFITVEEVPIYPGCSGTNEERKICFSEKVKKLVSRKFNGNLAGELGLSPGKKRITVLFKIDKKGDIVVMRARAPHKALEKEAIRVLMLLPKMTPGKMQGRTVNVKYVLPIVFSVE